MVFNAKSSHLIAYLGAHVLADLKFLATLVNVIIYSGQQKFYQNIWTLLLILSPKARTRELSLYLKARRFRTMFRATTLTTYPAKVQRKNIFQQTQTILLAIIMTFAPPQKCNKSSKEKQLWCGFPGYISSSKIRRKMRAKLLMI